MTEIQKKEKPDPERLKIAVDVWKHVVSVQMHFNDMEMKVRNLYFTILAASLGLIGAVKGKRIEMPILGDLSFSLALGVVAAIIPISMLFYFIDRHWYHRLLRGAVNQCTKIEETYKEELPEIQLGTEISSASRVRFSCWVWKWLFFFVDDKRFKDKGWLHSDHKIEVLYKSVIWGAVFIIIFYGGFVSIQVKGKPIIPYVVKEMFCSPDAQPQQNTTQSIQPVTSK